MPAKSRNNKKKYSFNTTKAPIELELPSFDPETNEPRVCLARRPGPQGLIKAGLLDSLDTLSAIASGGDHKQSALKIMEDPSQLAKATNLIDRVVVHCVVEPAVHMSGEQCLRCKKQHLEDDPDYDDLLFAEDVDLEDKTFILQWVMGGTSDLETFRRETSELMGSVAVSQSVPDKTK